MPRTKVKPDTHKNRRIVGFSLDPQMAREVRAYAKIHEVSLRTLFEELWADYSKPNAKSAPPKPIVGRTIVGFSLDPQLAREVKTYAATQDVPLRRLFEEMWEHKKPRGRK